MLGVLWRRKLLVCGVALVFGVGAFVTAHLLQKEYEASVVISPVSEDAGSSRLGGLGSLMSSVGGGLASLAGISLPPATTARTSRWPYWRSEALSERFIRENDLLPVFFDKLWDPCRPPLAHLRPREAAYALEGLPVLQKDPQGLH